MIYKKSLSFKIKTISDLKKIERILSKQINFKRLQSFSNNDWKKINKVKANISKFTEDLFKLEQPKSEKINKDEILIILENTLNRFN